MALERREDRVDVVARVVRVRRDAEVAGARGRDDALAVERLHEHGRVGRDDAEERAAALGLLGADAAALGVLIAVHDALGRLWWVPATGLGVAGFLLLVTVWPRQLDEGPNWHEFYETFGSGTAREVSRQMLAELLAAIDENERRTERSERAVSSFRWRNVDRSLSSAARCRSATATRGAGTSSRDPLP